MLTWLNCSSEIYDGASRYSTNTARSAELKPGMDGGAPEADALIDIQVNRNVFKQVAVVFGVIELITELCTLEQMGITGCDPS